MTNKSLPLEREKPREWLPAVLTVSALASDILPTRYLTGPVFPCVSTLLRSEQEPPPFSSSHGDDGYLTTAFHLSHPAWLTHYNRVTLRLPDRQSFLFDHQYIGIPRMLSPGRRRPKHYASPPVSALTSPLGACISPKGRKRASSFTGFINRLFPSNKPERGGTLRDHGFWGQEKDCGAKEADGAAVVDTDDEDDGRRDSNQILSWNTAKDLPQRTSSAVARHGKRAASVGHTPRAHMDNSPGGPRPNPDPPSATRVSVASRGEEVVVTAKAMSPPSHQPNTQRPRSAHEEQSRVTQLFESKREARRLRQSLKESGDFLGVQGVNPETGEMDVLTPTTSSDSNKPVSHSASALGGLAHMVKETREAYREAKRQHDTELIRVKSQREYERLDKLEREKEAIRAEQRKVRWRKDAGQWSSVAEPNLSPIAQSQRSGTPRMFSISMAGVHAC